MIIVLFHALYLFSKYVYESFHARKAKTEDVAEQNELLNVTEADYDNFEEFGNEHVEKDVQIKFFPPVYVQRYNAVQSVLVNDPYLGKIRKVVDFGCAELSFAIHLKNTDGIQQIYCVDVDRSLLENFQSKVAPLHCDYLSLRTEPLSIYVCEGSVAHNDNKLANCDAVICIELIEHLYPDDLEAFPYNVFGFIKPQVAIVTTPNADFNVLFTSLNGFRHADHKFEWTREQFQDWANNIISRYPDYAVTFRGVGNGPPGTEHLGSCSQMAVFHRETQLQNEQSKGVDGLLKTVVSHDYPYRTDNRSDEEKILDEAVYYIRLYSSRDDELSEEIPLKKLMFSVNKFHISIEILRSILEEARWAIADREDGPVVLIPPRSMFSSNSNVDYDDFLENDYRQHDGNDGWEALDLGAAPGYFFDTYMEGNTQNNMEEENWDDEVYNTRRSSRSNLNSENSAYPELHVPEIPDHTSDSQWTIEDLNNEIPLLLNNSEHRSITLVVGSVTENELPSESFSVALDCTDIDSLNTSTSTVNLSETNIPSPIARSDLSEALKSLRTNNNDCQSLPINSSAAISNNSSKEALQSDGNNTNTCIESSTNVEFSICVDICVSNILVPNTSQDMESQNEVQQVRDNYAAPVDKEPSKESCTSCNLLPTENNENCVLEADDTESDRRYNAEKNNVLENISHSTNDTFLIRTNDFPDQTESGPNVYEVTKTLEESTEVVAEKVDATELQSVLETAEEFAKIVPQHSQTIESGAIDEKLNRHTSKQTSDDANTQIKNRNLLTSLVLKTRNTDDQLRNISLEYPKHSSDFRPLGISKQIENAECSATSTSEQITTKSTFTTSFKSTPNDEVSTSYNASKILDEHSQLKHELEPTRAVENAETTNPFSPGSLDTPPNSWSPEIMDSGYPNSASVHDITPEYELSSIANDRISDSDSASIGEIPLPGVYEFVEVENGDLANNNRDDEGNNVIAFEADDLDDLQPLIDVLENDIENENDIYVHQNGFPMWLLRILEMANPIDLEGIAGRPAQMYAALPEHAGGDAPNANADYDEGFDSSSSDDGSDIEDDEADDATTISSDETEDHSAENLSRDWRAGGDP